MQIIFFAFEIGTLHCKITLVNKHDITFNIEHLQDHMATGRYKINITTDLSNQKRTICSRKLNTGMQTYFHGNGGQ
uniref:Rpl30 n=1 Tax=Arundo donax TaxID=35708 RepID=A0A0A9DFC6_ARUDO